jgi:hypothetical protein
VKNRMERLCQSLSCTAGATPEAILNLVSSLGFQPPEEYLEFLRYTNGAEGPIGDERYLVIWPVEEVAPLNEGYAVSEFAPGLFLFGGDGADTGYGFDTRVSGVPVVETPLIGMSRDELQPRARTFFEFLDALSAV